ncbi:HrpE/YscL family type III secretion apparatus protein [Candidatus Fukatsuia symbiotica]|uniref:Type III secretion protein n=1 Tax=Candidatus Fukatsuia symbiotica TaxID=1878942 RepID=A0A2U8I4C0_9GAMM|nr:type III secretion protein [Candidatus Fukatsuia symbiotica]AWK13996.1 type III secretion protein [Candidatus Fukatsuia symbiotica]MEA9445658.1 HrpE/YscL family type III secretion apparatus protein [Candidatus Fukatsuia symbiotica]
MNPFHISIQKRHYVLPLGTYIPADIFKKIDISLEIEAQAHARAQLIVQQAEKEKKALLAAAQQQATEIVEQKRIEMESTLLQRHVNWLVQAEQLDKVLVEQARSRIMQAITTVVQSWAGEQSVDKILITRLSDQVEEMAEQGVMILSAHPQQLTALEQAMGDRLKLRADANLAPDQAILASPLLSLKISLSDHLSQLVSWLHESSVILQDES